MQTFVGEKASVHWSSNYLEFLSIMNNPASLECLFVLDLFGKCFKCLDKELFYLDYTDRIVPWLLWNNKLVPVEALLLCKRLVRSLAFRP